MRPVSLCLCFMWGCVLLGRVGSGVWLFSSGLWLLGGAQSSFSCRWARRCIIEWRKPRPCSLLHWDLMSGISPRVWTLILVIGKEEFDAAVVRVEKMNRLHFRSQQVAESCQVNCRVDTAQADCWTAPDEAFSDTEDLPCLFQGSLYIPGGALQGYCGWLV